MLVTVGATEALAAAFLGMVNEGDEVSDMDNEWLRVTLLAERCEVQVIMCDPMYDAYSSMCQRSGATPIPIRCGFTSPDANMVLRMLPCWHGKACFVLSDTSSGQHAACLLPKAGNKTISQC